MNRSNVAFDDDRVGRQLPSICRPMAWERRRPYSANYPVDDYRLDDDMGAVSRTCLYQHSRHVPQRSRDDLFCHRPPVDSSRHLLEVPAAEQDGRVFILSLEFSVFIVFYCLLSHLNEFLSVKLSFRNHFVVQFDFWLANLKFIDVLIRQ